MKKVSQISHTKTLHALSKEDPSHYQELEQLKLWYHFPAVADPKKKKKFLTFYFFILRERHHM